MDRLDLFAKEIAEQIATKVRNSDGAITAKLESQGYVHYDWDANRITINFSVEYFPIEDHPLPEKKCEDLMVDIRKRFGVFEDGKPVLPHSFAAQMFAQRGYKNSSAPKDWLVKLDDIIELKIWTNPLSPKFAPVTCVGPLVGTSVLIQRK
jgi:hypothetical protein